jgi:hypothetical protein
MGATTPTAGDRLPSLRAYHSGSLTKCSSATTATASRANSSPAETTMRALV